MTSSNHSAAAAAAAAPGLDSESATPREEEAAEVLDAASDRNANQQQQPVACQPKVDGEDAAAAAAVPLAAAAAKKKEEAGTTVALEDQATASVVAASVTSPTSRRSKLFTMAQTPRHCNTNRARGGNNNNKNNKQASDQHHRDDNDDDDDQADDAMKESEGDDKTSTLISKMKMVRREESSPPTSLRATSTAAASAGGGAATAIHHQRHPSNNLEASLSLSLSSSSFSPTFYNTSNDNDESCRRHHIRPLQAAEAAVLHDPRRSDARTTLLSHEHPLQQPSKHTHHSHHYNHHHLPARYHPASAAPYPDDPNHPPPPSALTRLHPHHPKNTNHHSGDSHFFRRGAGAGRQHHHYPFHPHRRAEHPHASTTTHAPSSSRYYDQYPPPLLPPPPPASSTSSSYYHEPMTSSTSLAPSSRMHHHHHPPPPPPGYYYNDHPRYYDPLPHHPPRDYYDYYGATNDTDAHPPHPALQLHQQVHHRTHNHNHNPNHYYPASSMGDEDAFRECGGNNNRRGGGGGQHQQHLSSDTNSKSRQLQQQQQQRHRGLSTLSEDGSKENTNCGGDDGNASLHAVSSSFSNGTKEINNTMSTTTTSSANNSSCTILSLVAATTTTAKHSPGVGGVSSTSEGTNEEFTILQQESTLSTSSSLSLLPKSTNDGQEDGTEHTLNQEETNDVESPSNFSWRVLQQIASVDKEEMLRLQTSKSELTVATATSAGTAEEEGTNDGKEEEHIKKKNSSSRSAGLVTASTTATPKNRKEMPSISSSAMVSATATTTRSLGTGTLVSNEREIDKYEGVGNKNNKITKQDSPGELQPATSNISRTSSLSDSPAADDGDDNNVRKEGDGDDRDDENCREDGAPSNLYPPRSGNTMHPPPLYHYPHHQYHHVPPHHQHHPPYHPYMPRTATMMSESRSLHPPANLHPLRLSELEMFGGGGGGGLQRGAAATTGDDEYSPSASTISTKASLVLAKASHHQHPAGTSIGVKEEGQGGVTQQFVNNKYPPTPNMKPKHPVHVKKSREGGLNSADIDGNNHCFEASSSDQHVVAKRAKHCDASSETNSNTGNGPPPSPPPPKEDSPTVALDGCVMADSLGDDESPTAASAATGSQHSQQSLELGAMPSWETAGKPLAGWSICSGMESLKEAVMGSAFSFSGTIEDDSAMNNDDPSPKSILSKLGEKRRIAPGTHVQFSRDQSGRDNRLENTASSTPAGGVGSGSRKRSHGLLGWSQEPLPQSPRQLYDDYYYGEGPPPRHAAHPYDQYGDYYTPHHPPPPSHRYPREHAFYPEDDPYYDHYYNPHPPPPPPYGYPPHPRQVAGRHPHRPDYPPYPTNSMPPHHSPAVMGGRNNSLMDHTPPSTIHHPSLIHSQFSHNRALTTVVGNGVSYGAWTQEDDAALMELMKKVKSPENWDPIAKKLDRGKSPREIQERWTRFLKPGSRKGQWTEEEDAIVIEAVGNSVEDPFTRWSDLAQRLPGRVGKQVRDRWVNHLNPAISHLPFGREDDLLLWEGHNDVGKRWVEISCKYFKATRSENHIKNRWYSASFKKFIAKEFGPDAYRLANEIGGTSNGRNMASMADSHHQPPLKEGAPIVSGYNVSAHNAMSS